MARSRTSDYPVGYKRPPVDTQFKKGQSGNPRGRPKKAPQTPLPAGLSEESARILRLLEEEVSVKVDGRVRRIMRAEAVDRTLFEQALAGDYRALKHALELKERAMAAKAAREAAIRGEPSAALTVEIAAFIRAKRQGHIDSLPVEASGTPVGAAGPAPDDREIGDEVAAADVVTEEKDPFADSSAGECAGAVPEAWHPEPQPVSVEEPRKPAPDDAVCWGNAPTNQPDPPRVKRARRASPSEPLIKNTQPLSRRY